MCSFEYNRHDRDNSSIRETKADDQCPPVYLSTIYWKMLRPTLTCDKNIMKLSANNAD